jgi:hypothetical protein
LVAQKKYLSKLPTPASILYHGKATDKDKYGGEVSAPAI